MAFLISNPKRFFTLLEEQTPYIQKGDRVCRFSSALAIACERNKTESKRALASMVRRLPLVERTDIARVVAVRREKDDKSSRACEFEFSMAAGAEAEKNGNPALAGWFYGAVPDTGNKAAYRKRTERLEKARAGLLAYFDEKAYLSSIFAELSRITHSSN